MRVLVTGASGLLGAGVARALAERGDRVTVLQRRPSGLGLREVRADVADQLVGSGLLPLVKTKSSRPGVAPAGRFATSIITPLIPRL